MDTKVLCGKSDKTKHGAFEVKSPESDRGFTQKLWKTLWKRSAFTPMLPANVNVLAVCTKAGRPTSARFVAAKTYGLYCSRAELIEDVPGRVMLAAATWVIAATIMRAFDQI
jgi:hypothetical protein